MPLTQIISKSSKARASFAVTLDGLSIAVAKTDVTLVDGMYSMDDAYEYTVDASLEAREIDVYLAVNPETKDATVVVVDLAEDEPQMKPVIPTGYVLTTHIMQLWVPVGTTDLKTCSGLLFSIVAEEAAQ